ncbi:hypothetical protein B566_EDAN015205 [Ephemera danica]|nr:hypothetical protein B566_EDAN015205 [Ephemera danica]
MASWLFCGDNSKESSKLASGESRVSCTFCWLVFTCIDHSRWCPDGDNRRSNLIGPSCECPCMIGCTVNDSNLVGCSCTMGCDTLGSNLTCSTSVIMASWLFCGDNSNESSKLASGDSRVSCTFCWLVFTCIDHSRWCPDGDNRRFLRASASKVTATAPRCPLLFLKCKVSYQQPASVGVHVSVTGTSVLPGMLKLVASKWRLRSAGERKVKLMKNTPSYRVKKIQKSHRESLKIPETDVDAIEEKMWTVKSQSCEGFYVIEMVREECSAFNKDKLPLANISDMRVAADELKKIENTLLGIGTNLIIQPNTPSNVSSLKNIDLQVRLYDKRKKRTVSKLSCKRPNVSERAVAAKMGPLKRAGQGNLRVLTENHEKAPKFQVKNEIDIIRTVLNQNR